MSDRVAGDREKRSGSPWLLVAFALFCAMPIVPLMWRPGIAAGLLIVLCVTGLARRPRDASPVLFCLLAAAIPMIPMCRSWPLALLTPLIVYGLWIRAKPAFRPAFLSSLRGQFDGITIGLMILTVVGSTAGLVGWYQFTKLDLADLRAMVAPLPVWSLPLAGIGFAVLNATIEKAIWRGILWEMLGRAGPIAWLVALLQAISFGLEHIHGFPRGWIGVGLAGLYGLFLGWIRHRSGGLAAVVITHVFADLTIFVILAVLRSNGQS